MSGLTEFLLARIAEDEAWMQTAGDFLEECQECAFGQQPRSPYPLARLLAECEAKRRIIELNLSWPDTIRTEFRCSTFLPRIGDPGIVEQWSRDEDGDLLEVVRAWKRLDYEATVVQRNESPILMALALPYADHPDYREEWRP